jgi:hypothetical protein
VLHGLFSGILGCQLGGKRGTFTGALESLHTGTGPGNHIPGGVGNRYDGIIESRLNMNNARWIYFFFSFFWYGLFS